MRHPHRRWCNSWSGTPIHPRVLPAHPPRMPVPNTPSETEPDACSPPCSFYHTAIPVGRGASWPQNPADPASPRPRPAVGRTVG